ncbi:MAG: DUF899 domain-containing protein [Rhizobiales bacterium]|nr:DUF899 domain-containing protein [Hyphomicrobiales bacterium]
MEDTRTLVPATELAGSSPIRFAGESPDYRAARTALLAEEIELRRQIERVARLRRALPPGPVVAKDYGFVGREGPVSFADLFGRHDTLVVYKYMYGPERKQPCPMCTAAMSAWEGNAEHIGQRVSLVMVARSPIERLVAFAEARGWRHLRLYSDMSGEYTRDFVHPEDADVPGLNVFTRRDGTIRHFWGDEMGLTADPGEDPRGAPDLMPLWNFLDLTPEGRDPHWYPRLGYPG